MIVFSFIVLGLAVVILSAAPLSAAGPEKPQRTAIVLAAFGASTPSALPGLLKIRKRIEAEFPGIPVCLAFTSPRIRRVWSRRRNRAGWIAENVDISREFLEIKSPLAAIADLRDRGFDHIAVQSLHIHPGEEYINLKSCIDDLNSTGTNKAKAQSFHRLILGRPALGEPGLTRDYREDLKAAVEALRDDMEHARRSGAALVYMGHGNRFLSSGLFIELQDLMRKTYPDVLTFVGVIEGSPGLDAVLSGLKAAETRKIILAPLLLVAGGHALKDMNGNRNDSWKSILVKAGFQVECIMRGLGELDPWTDIYVRHLKETMTDHDVPC
jgi:sirohydrochlorin cobaltochelatase